MTIILAGLPIPDGDKGDITVSGSLTSWSIDNDVVTNSKAANMAEATAKMRAVGAGTGDPIDGTPDQLSTMLDEATDPFLRTSAATGDGTVLNHTCNGRLTLESGVPVSLTDQTAKTTIYFTPLRGNQVALYSGAAWAYHALTEKSLALGTLTADKNYDVFLYDNAGTLTLELSAAWSSNTARTDALALQDGVYVKSGATTRRYLGTIRTTSTTTTEDSGGGTTTNVGGKRFVYNHYNRMPRFASVIDTTDSWSYTTDTIRQARATAGNLVEYVDGIGDVLVHAVVLANHTALGNSTKGAKAGVGVDSTSAFSGLVGINFTTTGFSVFSAIRGEYNGHPGIGYHYLSWNEKGGAAGTSMFSGDNGADSSQSGLTAVVVL